MTRELYLNEFPFEDFQKEKEYKIYRYIKNHTKENYEYFEIVYDVLKEINFNIGNENKKDDLFNKMYDIIKINVNIDVYVYERLDTEEQFYYIQPQIIEKLINMLKDKEIYIFPNLIKNINLEPSNKKNKITVKVEMNYSSDSGIKAH